MMEPKKTRTFLYCTMNGEKGSVTAKDKSTAKKLVAERHGLSSLTARSTALVVAK